ncbi:MAG TPA: GYD domain-containing protein [Dehalococcoidia bacterium]|jgi:uncharacterized protein with GYD domain
MPNYLLQVAYTPEAWTTMTKKPQDRLAAVRPAIEKLGGKLETGYFAFGEYDIIALISMKTNVDAAAFAIAAAAGGGVSKIKTTVLMTTAEAMDAMKKAGASAYRAPSARAASKR